MTPAPSNTTLRVGAVNYLNSKPLIRGFVEQAHRLGLNATLRCDLPSRLADSLADGRFDVALVPLFEGLSHDDWRLVSDACVAADGPVGSVKVYFRRPPHTVRTLALDEGSRTSAALCRVLLAKRFDAEPERVSLPIGCGLADTDADAVLLIGDRAMHPPAAHLRGQFVAGWDLAEEWRIETGLPFVFAAWFARGGVDDTSVAELLQRCRDDGLSSVAGIAAAEGPPLGLTTEHAESYLRENLRFRLGSRERSAIHAFQTHCREAGLLPSPAAAQ